AAGRAWRRRGGGDRCNPPADDAPREGARLYDARSERNVVVFRCGRGAGRRLLGGSRAAWRLGAAPAAAQELHALRDDLGDVAAVAFLFVVLAGAGWRLDVDLPALGQVLAAGLRPFAPHPPVVPLGWFPVLA